MLRVCRFYQCYKLEDILNMPLDVYRKLVKGMSMIEAHEQLTSFQSQDWPNSKKEKRSKLHKELHSIAYPKKEYTKQVATQADINRILGIK